MSKTQKEGDFTKEDAYKNLNRVNEWLNNGDNKISFSLAFIGVLVGLFFSSYKLFNTFVESINILKYSIKNNIIDLFIAIIGLGFIFFSCRALLFLYNGLKAQINPDIYSGNNFDQGSKLFWESISKSEFQDFEETIIQIKEKELIKDINSQTFINSIICSKKFKSYNKGVESIKKAVILFFLYGILVLFS
ncbi:MAG: hypothetical protein AWL62_349 [Halanaerobium sp. T82-1]|jgi:hypothetical protein|nr:MAG: hypothetical protein AWL62_349 [Halanaerobium sp. T82-1]